MPEGPQVAEGNDWNLFVQWKGTDVCLDFNCPCGWSGHYDGLFAYALKCARCGAIYKTPDVFVLVPLQPGEEVPGSVVGEGFPWHPDSDPEFFPED